MPVKAEDAEKEFRAFLRDRGTPFETLGAEDGLNAMISFYREVRVTGLRFEKDEDTLLLQWGCYEQTDGFAFVFDITRQLILSQPEEDSIWQLHLSFYFRPTDQLLSLGSDNRWCESLDALPSFVSFLRDHSVIAALSPHSPQRRSLNYGQV